MSAQIRSLAEGIRDEIRNYADQQRAMLERLDRFEVRNDREHRLLQTQIAELDAQLQSRRRGRRR